MTTLPAFLRASLLLALSALALSACAPVDGDAAGQLAETTEALTVPVLSNCNESTIRANAPPDASAMLDRAYNWIHRGVPYCECVVSQSAPFRSDCSGFVSMVWGLHSPPQGHTTYSFAGGPWDDHSSIRLSSRSELRVGDALNYPGNVSAGTGHIVLFGGWLDGAHTRFCSLEESHTGTPARVITRSVDPVYLPIRLASRHPGPLCTARCSGSVFIDGDCDRHECGTGGGRCVDDAHGARCVDHGCPTWGSDTVCSDARTVIACVNGNVHSTTHCTGANPHCSAQGTGERCESPVCPATGRHSICLASGQLADCVDGLMGAGHACGAGTFCSEATPGAAACAAHACVAAAADVPVAHDACLTGGAQLHCDAHGAATTVHCPAGQACSIPDAHRCVAAACPAASGTVAVCSPAGERVVCNGGVVTERTPCDGTCVANDGTPARCVASACVTRGPDGHATLPAAHSLCQADGTVGQCDDEGQLTSMTCAAGSHCAVGAGAAASCVGAATADAGAVTTSDAGTTAGDSGTGASEDDAATEQPADDDAGEQPVDDDAGDAPPAEVFDPGGCSVGHGPGDARGGAMALVLVGLAGAVRRRRCREAMAPAHRG